MRSIQLLPAAALIALLAACGEKPKTEKPVIKPAGSGANAAAGTPAPPVETAPAAPPVLSGVDLTTASEYNASRALQTVYFETDAAEIPATETAKLDLNAKWLADHPQFKLLVEGNCDERNTEEYNLALGQQRAEKVRAYLLGKGVKPERVKTISYGETQPVDPGHDEPAWRKNRRADFKLLDR